MAPLNLASISTLQSFALYGAIGFGFGYALEWAGFGDTRKLAAQFYLTEMTVLKVMFTAIVVAAVLIFGATSLGLLDMSRVWVNPTYLWPGIVGGLIMGVGFVVGGFCPGTSLVAAATLKLDGVFFVLGCLFGVGVFGGTVSSFESFWLSSFYGRFTIPEWLHLPVGVTLVGVVLMAVGAFAFAGWVERRQAGFVPVGGAPSPSWMPRARQAGAIVLTLAAVVVALRGQPSSEQKWAWASPALHRMAIDRAPFADPAEVVALRKDTSVLVKVIDLRSEHDFNLFHIGEARRVDASAVTGPEELRGLLSEPPSTVTFLVGNGEEVALGAWERLKGEGAANVYVVEGGVNHWLDVYPPPSCVAERGEASGDDLAWRFRYAAGATLPSSSPDLPESRAFLVACEPAGPAPAHWVWPARSFDRKVKLQTKALVKGGCG